MMIGKKLNINISALCALLFLMLVPACSVYSQSLRSHVNKGVELYDKGKIPDAEVEFKKGLEKAPKNFQANFNLGDTYYKQNKYKEALKSYEHALLQTKNKGLKAKVYHNIGNSLLKSKKIKESIEAYKNSLALNPKDESTKYNLSYALNMLKNNKNKQKNKNDKNDKNKKDQKNQKNQKNNQNKNDKDKNKQQQNKNQQDKNKQDRQKQQNQKQQNQKDKQQQAKQNQAQQKNQNKISKQQAENILRALTNNEKELQKKLRKMKGKPIKTNKDW